MKYIAPLLALATSAAAHGYVQSVFVKGNEWLAFRPFTDLYQTPNPRPITRKIAGDGPVTDFNSKAMTCGDGAQDAKWRTSSHAPVNAGDQLTFQWDRWPDDHKGTVIAWMAECGTSCETFDAAGDDWFKIDQMGLVSGTTDTGVWATGLLIKNKLQWTVTIPKSLKASAYLIRVELLAMHAAGQPQFYPSCSQLVVSGSGNAVASASEKVAIPGYYAGATASTGFDIWKNGQTSYPIAGPAVASLAAFKDSDPVNSSGGLKLGSTTPGKIVTSFTGAASSSSSSSGGSSDANAAADDKPATTTKSAAGSGATSSPAAAGSSSGGKKSCKVSRRKRDDRRRSVDGATKSKKRHGAKRLEVSY